MNLLIKTALSFSLFSSVVIPLSADDYTETLNRIVANNPRLVAAFGALDAEKAENLTGLNLENPEVELSYQWGVPADVPDKKTIDVSQGFDFATLSGAKKRLAKLRNAGAEAAFNQSLREVAAEADALMTDIVFQRRMALYYDSALNLMGRTLEAARAALEKGEMTIVDFNSIRMDLNGLETDKRLNDIDYQGSMGALAALGGASNISWSSSDYAEYSLPPDFREWVDANVANDAMVRQADNDLRIANGEVSLRKSENLPSFSVGYTSELVKDANYYGVTLGVQLPLWANAGRVKAARAAANAAKVAGEKAALDFELKQRALYDKAILSSRLLDQNRRLVKECDIRKELDKLYSLGQISTHEYLAQLMSLLELNKKVIEAEYSYQKALSEFRATTIRL